MRKIFAKSVWPKRIIIFLLSYLCVLSFAGILYLQESGYIAGRYFGRNLSAVAIFAITAWLLNRFFTMQDKRLKVVSSIGGVLLGLVIVYGSYCHFVNDIFRSAGENILQVFMILGISALTTPLIAELFLWLNKIQVWYLKKCPENPVELTKKKRVRFFCLSWLILFLAYIPLFLAEWPGNFIYDGIYQLRNVIHNAHSTHHPLAHTLLMGMFYNWGRSIGDASTGFQFYTLLQMLVLSASFAYFLLYVYKKRAPKCVWIGILLWYALHPIHALFAITSTKDVLCAAFLLFFIVFILRYFVDRESFHWYSYAGMIASGAGAILYRNNVMYAIVLFAIAVFVLLKGLKAKLKAVSVILAVILLSHTINEVMIHCTDATEPDTYRETLSVPLQGLARVASYRRDELPQELYDEICIYIQEADIPNYNPYISDAVKNNANEVALKTNTLNFFKLWAKVGLRFPDEYVESFLTNTLGYYYPLASGVYISTEIALYHTLIGDGEEIEKRGLEGPIKDLYSHFFWKKEYESTPILGFSFRCMLYVWILVLFLFWSIWKKNTGFLMPGILLFAYILTCFAGPTVMLRYIFCVVTATPVLIYLMMSSGNRDTED